MRPLRFFTGPIHRLKGLSRRLSGATGPAVDDVRDVFRAFADHMERRVVEAPSPSPKIRLAGGDDRGGTRTWP